MKTGADFMHDYQTIDSTSINQIVSKFLENSQDDDIILTLGRGSVTILQRSLQWYLESRGAYVRDVKILSGACYANFCIDKKWYLDRWEATPLTSAIDGTENLFFPQCERHEDGGYCTCEFSTIPVTKLEFLGRFDSENVFTIY